MRTLLILLLSSLLATAGHIKLAWDDPGPQQTSIIEGYRVHWGLEPGTYTNVVTVAGEGFRATVPNLPDGVTIYSALSAYNATGDSPLSEEISFVARPDAPTAPTGLRVVIEQSNNLQDWQPIASVDVPADSPAAFYRARITPTEQTK